MGSVPPNIRASWSSKTTPATTNEEFQDFQWLHNEDNSPWETIDLDWMAKAGKILRLNFISTNILFYVM